MQGHPDLKGAIREYFLQTYSLYEQLFKFLATDEAYFIRSEPLRHPLIFYYGHTACLYINKLFDYGMIKERVNPEYEKILAVGVDEMDWDDLNQAHYDWPSVPQVREFRAQVKQVVLDVIDSSKTTKIDNWLTDLYVILLGIEH